jgi:hypothetical protein
MHVLASVWMDGQAFYQGFDLGCVIFLEVRLLGFGSGSPWSGRLGVA